LYDTLFSKLLPPVEVYHLTFPFLFFLPIPSIFSVNLQGLSSKCQICMPKMFVLVPYFCLCYIFFNFLLLLPFLVGVFFFHLLFERLYILVLLLRACHKRMRTFVFIIVIFLEMLTNSLFSFSLQINLHLQISSFIREILGISSSTNLVAK
jgi:hypothetical protein